MKTLLPLLFGFLLLAGIAAILAPHRAVAQASEYAALFAQCRASGGTPPSTALEWMDGGCKCDGVSSGLATCPQNTDADIPHASNTDLNTQGVDAMAKGMMNGNSQEFGLGAGIVILNGMLDGSQDDGAAAAQEAAQEAAEKRRQEALRKQAEQEQARRLAAAKSRILGVLKDDPDSGDDPFKTIADPGAVAVVPEGPLIVGGLALKSDDDSDAMVVDLRSAARPQDDATSRDTMVVDLQGLSPPVPRPLDDAIATACAGTPEGVCERVRKGFQAVMTKDWNVAIAWFKDASSRDPGNAWLQDLAAHSAETAAKPPAPGSALTSADLDRLLAAKDAQAQRLHDDGPAIDAEFDAKAKAAEQQRSLDRGVFDKVFDLYYDAPPAAVTAQQKPAAVTAQQKDPDDAMHRAYDLYYDPPSDAPR